MPDSEGLWNLARGERRHDKRSIAGRLVGWNYWDGAGAIPFFVGLGALGLRGGMDLKDPGWTSARQCTQQGGTMAVAGCSGLSAERSSRNPVVTGTS
jgi:hypothetical protein